MRLQLKKCGVVFGQPRAVEQDGTFFFDATAPGYKSGIGFIDASRTALRTAWKRFTWRGRYCIPQCDPANS
jgi:hypothetical protein